MKKYKMRFLALAAASLFALTGGCSETPHTQQISSSVQSSASSQVESSSSSSVESSTSSSVESSVSSSSKQSSVSSSSKQSSVSSSSKQSSVSSSSKQSSVSSSSKQSSVSSSSKQSSVSSSSKQSSVSSSSKQSSVSSSLKQSSVSSSSKQSSVSSSSKQSSVSSSSKQSSVSSSSKQSSVSSSSKQSSVSSSSKQSSVSSSSKQSSASSSSKQSSASSSSKQSSASSSSKQSSASSSSKQSSVSSSSKQSSASSSSKPAQSVDQNTCKHNIVIDSGRAPEYDKPGLTQGSHCSICNKVFNKQYSINVPVNFVPTSITMPTATSKGTAVYTDKKFGNFTVSFDSIPTEQEVYQKLIAFQDKYPEKTPFTNEGNSYITEKLMPYVTYEGKGCAAFAVELSDAAFGDFPGRYSFDFENVRAGDIIRLAGDSHSVIVLKVEGDTVTIAEGNYNRSVHWGRTLKISDAVNEWNYIITRYPN